jgi:hypothetical protein
MSGENDNNHKEKDGAKGHDPKKGSFDKLLLFLRLKPGLEY